MTLSFSNLFKHTRQTGAISPNSEYIAIAIDERLTIRRLENLKIVKIYETPYISTPQISQILWSPNSRFVLTANFSESSVHLWSVFGDSNTFMSGFVDQAQGILACCFSPMNDAVLTWSEYKLRLTIWNLSDGSEKYIQYPKHIGKGISFHPNGQFVAILLRAEHKDQIALYSTISWNFIKAIPVDTIDAQDVLWSRDGNCICVLDTTGNYLVQIYNSVGILKKSLALPENELGAQTAAWSPLGQILALGGFDQKARLLNNITWQPIALISLKPAISHPRVEILTESPNQFKSGYNFKGTTNQAQSISKFTHSISPATIQKSVASDLSKPFTKSGIHFLEFNADGSLLQCLNANTPNAIWIWSMSEMRIVAVIQSLNAIRKSLWSPTDPKKLVFVTGNSQTYLYLHGEDIFGYQSAAEDLEFLQFSWSLDGKSVLVFDKSLFVVVSVNNSEE